MSDREARVRAAVARLSPAGREFADYALRRLAERPGPSTGTEPPAGVGRDNREGQGAETVGGRRSCPARLRPPVRR